MTLFSLLKLLLKAVEVVQQLMAEAAERKKAGNLETIHAAVSDLKQAKTQEEKDEATKRIQAAFKSR